MKIVLSYFFLLFSHTLFSQVPIQFYDFETNANRTMSETEAEFNINSVSDNNISSIGGSFSTGAGNPGTGSSLFRSSWDENGATDLGTGAKEYLEFTVNTSGFAQLYISLDAKGSLLLGTAGSMGLLYSTGGSFTATPSKTLTTSFANYEWDLSAITDIDNKSEITFRIYAYGDPLLGTADLYVDNLTISANKITASKTLADYSLIDDANGADEFPVFNDLTVDGSGATYTLSSFINFSGTLTLTNGVFSTGSYSINLDSNCVLQGYSSNSYVDGNFEHTFHTKPLTQTKFYPVGSGSKYRPVEITLADVTTAGRVRVNHSSVAPSSTSLPSGITNLSTVGYWDVDLAGSMTFGGANAYGVKLFFDAGDGVSDTTPLEVVRGTNGGAWTESSQSSAGADWVLGSFNSPTDNNFAFGDDGINPLPVELLEFDYYVEKNNLVMYWITATEVNSFMFEIERKSIETSQWERRGYVVASGVSNSEKTYSYFEEDPVIGSSFYRIKIIDNDGSYEYSKSIQVKYDPNVTGIEEELTYEYKLYQNYPNPFNPSTKISYSVPDRSFLTLSIYSITGELIVDLESGIKELGNHSLEWDAANNSSGIYILLIKAESLDQGTKFFDTKKLVLIK